MLTEPEASAPVAPKKKRKSGVPTGNAGEYFVMGELLRRGFDAQLADRNTKGYDLLTSRPPKPMQRVQVKTVRSPPWYVNAADFEGDGADQVTVYVLLGREDAKKPVRFFIARNRDLTKPHQPPGWRKHGFMPLKDVEEHKDRWDAFE